MPEAVTVRGVGRVEVRPDVAVAEFGTEVRRPTLGEALTEAAHALEQMMVTLRTGGVSDADLRDHGPSTYVTSDDTGRPTGYVCARRLTARITELAHAGALLADSVAAAGDAGRVHGVSYTVSDRDVHLRQARILAVADARARAEQLTELVRRPLGRALQVTECDAHGSPPGPLRLAMSSGAEGLESGTEEVTACVEVIWAFAD